MQTWRLSAQFRTELLGSAPSEHTSWQWDECSNRTVGHSAWSNPQRLRLLARITRALVRYRAGTHTGPSDSWGDLVILSLILRLGGARTGDGSLRLGRLLLDGRLVVFLATGEPQQARDQESKAQSTGDYPHDEYSSPQKWAPRRLIVEEVGAGTHHSPLCNSTRATPSAGRGTPRPTGRPHWWGSPPAGVRGQPSGNDHARLSSCYVSRARAARLSAPSVMSWSTSRCQARPSSCHRIIRVAPTVVRGAQEVLQHLLQDAAALPIPDPDLDRLEVNQGSRESGRTGPRWARPAGHMGFGSKVVQGRKAIPVRSQKASELTDSPLSGVAMAYQGR